MASRSTTSLALKLAIAVLMVDSIIELSFISATVGWLHATASGTFPIRSGDGATTFDLRGEPATLLTDQGHTSNGASGTAFVLIGLGGIIALWLRRAGGRVGASVYHLWVAVNFLALMLTLGALAYVFAVTNAHSGQDINIARALSLNGAQYPLEHWTPQGWFAAVLRLDVADDGVRGDIESHYRIMLGWQYNLIPFFLIQLVETVLAVMDYRAWKRERVIGHDVYQMKA